jgi:hypothetical protein
MISGSRNIVPEVVVARSKPFLGDSLALRLPVAITLFLDSLELLAALTPRRLAAFSRCRVRAIHRAWA